MRHLRFGPWFFALGCVFAVTQSCGGNRTTHISQTGKLKVQLIGVASSGTTYRLSSGTFSISGASETSVSTSTAPEAPSIAVDLPIGDYLVRLLPGWVLERAAPDGSYSPVEAELTSDNPVAVTVRSEQTTDVRFRFAVGVDVVSLDTGRLAIGIDVEERLDAGAEPTDAGGCLPGSGVFAGLLGLWHLDGNAADSSGNARDGTIVGATPIDGRVGQAYRFNGSAHIDVGDIAFVSDTYTVSLWLRATQPVVGDDFRMVIGKVDLASGNNPLEILANPGGQSTQPNALGFQVWLGWLHPVNTLLSNDMPPDEIPSAINGRDGAWHMATAVFAPGAQAFYVDGVLFATSSYEGALPPSSGHVRIGGADYGAYHHPWIGDIDEVSIYDRPLTAAEVSNLYRCY